MKIFYSIITCFLFLSPATSFAANFSGNVWPVSSWPGTTGVLYRYSSEHPLSPHARATFEEALEFYQKNTLIQFEERDNNVDAIIVRSGEGSSSFVGPKRCHNLIFMIYCPTPVMTLTDNVTLGTVKHEILHALGFHHEHQRSDRDEYIWFDSVSLLNDQPSLNDRDFLIGPSRYSINYGLKSESNNVGSYDPHSILHYRTPYFSMKVDDPFELIDLMMEDSETRRGFRITVENSTQEPFDNLGLYAHNVTSSPEPTIVAFETGWHSALWDFQYTETGEYFHINSFSRPDLYLVENASGDVVLAQKDSVDLSLNRSQWKIYIDDGKFFLKNRFSENYLRSHAGAATYSQTPSPWMIHLSMPEHAQTLSPMDHIALHWAYGRVFRVQISDSSITPEEKESLYVYTAYSNGSVQSEGINVDVLSTINGENGMWALERHGQYFRFWNFGTGEYLAIRDSQLDLYSLEEVDSWGEGLNAKWEIEPLKNSVRIRNRLTGEYIFNNEGRLGLTETPITLDSNWDFDPVENVRIRDLIFDHSEEIEH